MAWKNKLERNDVRNIISGEKVDPDILHNLLAGAIADLNFRGALIMDLAEDARRQTFLIEQQFTAAINSGDKLKFYKLLAEWQGYFN